MNLEILRDGIATIQKEVGISNYSSFFEFILNELDTILRSDLCPIDIFISTELNNHQIKNFEQLNECKKYKFNIHKNVASIFCNKFENLQSTIAFLIVGNSYDNVVINNFFVLRAETYKNIFVINVSELMTENPLENYSKKHKNLQILEGFKDIESVTDYLNSTFTIQQLEIIKALSIVKTLEPIIIYLGEIIKSETQLLQTRKLILSQDANNARKNDLISNLSELNSTLRQLIQKNLVELERSFKTKYEDLNKNNIGVFSSTLNNILESFKFESIEKVNVAGKTETLETKINEKFINDFLKKITQAFKLEAEKDIQYIDKVIESSFEKINNNLKQKKIEDLNISKIVKPDLGFLRLVESHVYIQKKYAGELTKQGIMEYFVALRDYTGIIMMVVGIFGPLTLMSADSGAKEGEALFFLNSISVFLKPVRQVLQLITITLVASMLVLGIYDLRKRIPKKRLEQKEKDFEKAKESLLAEGKRVFNDISRDWNSSLSLFLKDYAQNIQNELDLSMKSYFSKNTQNQQVKKNNQSLEQANLELKVKSLTTAERLYETLQRKFGDMKLSAAKT